MKLRHFFMPHPDTHKRAHLISHNALLLYVLVFLSFQLFISSVKVSHPGILGIASNIDQQTVIALTNKERAKYGLPALKENAELDKAAQAKGENMFAENYWAHFAPSGKSPWDFIKGSGYQFSYAGENLARNFYDSPDVVTAWMNSPSHRQNILDSHYQDIGIAVVNGTLLGEQTTLVVQEFGTPVGVEVANAPAPLTPPEVPAVPNNVASAFSPQISKPLIDPFQASRTLGLVIIGMVMGLLILDYIVLRKRAVYRVAAIHLPQLLILMLAAGAILTMGPGLIH